MWWNSKATLRHAAARRSPPTLVKIFNDHFAVRGRRNMKNTRTCISCGIAIDGEMTLCLLCAATKIDQAWKHKIVSDSDRSKKTLIKKKINKVLAKPFNKLPSISKKQTKNGDVTCVLCGKHIEKGGLLQHKYQVHGENKILRSPVSRRKNVWATFVQGGLPGLGKNSK